MTGFEGASPAVEGRVSPSLVEGVPSESPVGELLSENQASACPPPDMQTERQDLPCLDVEAPGYRADEASTFGRKLPGIPAVHDREEVN